MKRAGFSCAVLTAAALMTLGSAATAFAGEWVAEGTEWRYLENNGTYAADSWETDNGVSYYIGSDGYGAYRPSRYLARPRAVCALL